MPSLQLTHGPLHRDPIPALSVDGLLERGPNLSHWPGNRTPARWKADLSTGICLNFARADRLEQEGFLDGSTAVANDHYDTDGFLSLLAVLRPNVALAREEVCLAAAGTGDYQRLITRRAFAIDRTVLGLSTPASPVAGEFAGLSGAEKELARYRWLIDHAVEVLDRPEAFAALWRDEWQATSDEVQGCKAGGAATRRMVHGSALAVVASGRPLRRMTLNTFAGGLRVLHAVEEPGGTLFRYHDRTESWFEVTTFCPPPRVDLARARERLAEAEGSREDGAQWCSDPPNEPVPELYFGIPAPQAYGALTRELRPSRLGLEKVVEVLAEELRLRD